MNNPLADQQREKKGAETFDKYDYQYHWAFKKLLDEHKQRKEYAIFVEFHEDVVFANSLKKEIAEFEFYQIKENSGSSQHTVNSLTTIKQGSRNSVLGKLITSYQGKTFRDLISSASLVATSGFSKAMVRNDLELEEINSSDIKLKCLAKFKKKVLEELELEECPVNIRFIVPRLSPGSYRDSVIAGIVDLINSVYPNSQCDALNIYRVLIDELHRKGKVKYDFSKWDILLKEKSITSKTVNETIQAHSSLKGLAEMEHIAEDLISDLKLSFPQRRRLMQSIGGYYTRKMTLNSSLSVKFGKEIKSLYYQYQGFDTKELIQQIEESLAESLKQYIRSNDDLTAAIICEIAIGEL